MLTHLEERPEKCPIETCEYHTKGFARKYDKNRHALTHYKGTMVCPFCPGAGSAYEKAFNRADVFKRHLTAVHNVEQTPPNSRKLIHSGGSGRGGSAGESGKPGARCSICSSQFQSAQEFYEHLDDCVLNVIVPPTPKKADDGGGSANSSVHLAPSVRTPTTASTERGKEADSARDQPWDVGVEGSYEHQAIGGEDKGKEPESYPGTAPELGRDRQPEMERDEENKQNTDERTESTTDERTGQERMHEREERWAEDQGTEPSQNGPSKPDERRSLEAERSENREYETARLLGPEVTLGSPVPPDKMETDP